MYSLNASYYTKEFATLQDLLNDIMVDGMDPNYEITLDEKSTGEMAIDLIRF